MMRRKLRTGESEQNRTEINEGKNFVWLVIFIKLGFRQSNIVSIGILSLLVKKKIVLLSFSSSNR